jgi:hypothetical protein
MTALLRPLLRGAILRGRSPRGGGKSSGIFKQHPRPSPRLLATQSGDDARRPTALAKLFLEDGTELTGRSFGCHESVEGEVRAPCAMLGLNVPSRRSL